MSFLKKLSIFNPISQFLCIQLMKSLIAELKIDNRDDLLRKYDFLSSSYETSIVKDIRFKLNNKLNNEIFQFQKIVGLFNELPNYILQPIHDIHHIPFFQNTASISVDKKYIFNDNGRKFGSLSERLTCKVFEEYLGRQVKTNIRPNFLKNPITGHNLELDIFDPETNIAIEYNGIQHYEYVKHWHKNDPEKYKKQLERDIIKRKLCYENGIILIIVKYDVDTVFFNNKYVKSTLNDREIKIKNYLLALLNKL